MRIDFIRRSTIIVLLIPIVTVVYVFCGVLAAIRAGLKSIKSDYRACYDDLSFEWLSHRDQIAKLAKKMRRDPWRGRKYACLFIRKNK